jgi:hypothetical protein
VTGVLAGGSGASLFAALLLLLAHLRLNKTVAVSMNNADINRGFFTVDVLKFKIGNKIYINIKAALCFCFESWRTFTFKTGPGKIKNHNFDCSSFFLYA